MAFVLNYQKRKNKELFRGLEANEEIQLHNAQNYVPLYSLFFSLNESNYNSVNLNHKWALQSIMPSPPSDHTNVNCNHEHLFVLKDIHSEKTREANVFLKMAPLLNPFKYLVGKYDINDESLFQLPKLPEPKYSQLASCIADPNNSAYVDGHFTFLASTLIHNHGFAHGVDYYGGIVGLKKNYTIDVIDDLEYLVESDFFNTKSGPNGLFTVEDYSHLFVSSQNGTKLAPITIHKNESHRLSVGSIHENMYEDLFEPTIADLSQPTLITLNDLKDMSLDLVDLDLQNIGNEQEEQCEHIETKSRATGTSTSCSSRTSHTNSNDEIEESVDGEENENDANRDGDDPQNELKCEEESQGENASKTETDAEQTNQMDDSSTQSGSSFVSEMEEKIHATINQFPVYAIAMEKCEDTLDNLIVSSDLSSEEWLAMLMQVIMILITYQQAFCFTHNDLHTNNIMYNETSEKYLYYLYKKQYYKVPTFGRIFKIIDYGRSIYKCNGLLFCSDSFKLGNDAATQYNTEPYFNNNKPRLDPNYSFDLCRLACSMYDFLVDITEDDTTQPEEPEPHVKIIKEWCLDDNNLNVLYKTNGVERYPGFKLYKMIARCVHKHTPKAQLARPEFSKFIVSKSNVKRSAKVMNMDAIPCYA